MAMTRAGTPELEMVLKRDAKPVLQSFARREHPDTNLGDDRYEREARIVYDRQ
jgi:hypothetical protein